MKIHFSILLFSIIILFSCTSKDGSNNNSTNGIPVQTVPQKEETPKETPEKKVVPQEIPAFEMQIPKGHSKLSEASGDLNKDGIDEKIVVLNNGIISDFGEERTIFIFKLDNGAWKMWEKATGAILPSEHGGMMGDPFQSIEVNNGALVIEHFGGSRSKWVYTHRFRFQNDKWELIGATETFGTPCLDRVTFDYNLSSGNVIYEEVDLSCQNGANEKVKATNKKVNFNHKKDQLPVLDGFDPSSVYAIDAKTGKCYPEGTCLVYQKKK